MLLYYYNNYYNYYSILQVRKYFLLVTIIQFDFRRNTIGRPREWSRVHRASVSQSIRS